MLSAEQVNEYREKGWTVLPSLFDDVEVQVLRDAVNTLMDYDGPEVARENNGAPHVVYGTFAGRSPAHLGASSTPGGGCTTTAWQ